MNDSEKKIEALVGPMTVGKLIKVYRHSHEMKQNDLARKLKVTIGYISNIETGKKKISLEKVLEICKKLKQSQLVWMTVHFEEMARDAGKEYRIKIEWA